MFINPSRRWVPAEPWILLRAGVEAANRVDTQTQQELLQGRIIVAQAPEHRVHAAMLWWIVPPINIHQELLFGRIMGSSSPLPERQQPLLHGGRTTP